MVVGKGVGDVDMGVLVCVSVCACRCVCVRACVRMCVRACMCVYISDTWTVSIELATIKLYVRNAQRST